MISGHALFPLIQQFPEKCQFIFLIWGFPLQDSSFGCFKQATAAKEAPWMVKWWTFGCWTSTLSPGLWASSVCFLSVSGIIWNISLNMSSAVLLWVIYKEFLMKWFLHIYTFLFCNKCFTKVLFFAHFYWSVQIFVLHSISHLYF